MLKFLITMPDVAGMVHLVTFIQYCNSTHQTNPAAIYDHPVGHGRLVCHMHTWTEVRMLGQKCHIPGGLASQFEQGCPVAVPAQLWRKSSAAICVHNQSGGRTAGQISSVVLVLLHLLSADQEGRC